MNTNELDKVIHIDNPLEPEKGGFYKAFAEHFDEYIKMRDYRIFNELTGVLERPSVYLETYPDDLPFLNIETGKRLDINFSDLTDKALDHANYGVDHRAISYHTAKELGLNFYDEPELLKRIQNSCKDNSYFNSVVKNGLLVSVSEVKDPELILALDAAGRAMAPKLSFDDAKYEPIFNKLDQYFNYFRIMNHGFRAAPTDKINDTFNKTLSFNDLQQRGIYPYSFCSPMLACNTVHYEHDKQIQADHRVSLPKPIYFRSASDYLKAHTFALAKSVLHVSELTENRGISHPILFSQDLSPLALNKNDRQCLYANDGHILKNRMDFVCAVAGTMIAAKMGAEITQNDIKKLYFSPCADLSGNDSVSPINELLLNGVMKQEIKQYFDIAAKVANHIASKEVELSKNNSLEPLSKSTWTQWKEDHERHAMQMATPSIPQICKQYNVEVTRDNVLKALNDLTSQKVNEVAQSKEQIKAALSQDQSINQAIKHFDLQPQKLSDLNKTAQTKGAER